MRNYRVISDGCARDLVSETAQSARIGGKSVARLCGAKRGAVCSLGLFELEPQGLGLLLPVMRQGHAHDQIGGQMGWPLLHRGWRAVDPGPETPRPRAIE